MSILLDGKIVSEKELIYKIPDPEERHKLLTESIRDSPKRQLDLLKSDISICPRNQKYGVYTIIYPYETVYDLYYSWAFTEFIKIGKSNILKYIADSDNEYDKDDTTILFDRYEKYINGEFKIIKDNIIAKEIEANKGDEEVLITKLKHYDEQLDNGTLTKDEYEKKIRFDKASIADRVSSRRKLDENDMNDAKKRHMSSIFRYINNVKRIRYIKHADYIIEYFKKFVSKNRKVLDEKFDEKYNTVCGAVIKLWGSFKSEEAAYKFCKKIKDKAPMGNTFYKEIGVNQMLDNTSGDTKYIDKQMNEIMSGFANKQKQAKEELMHRKEVLKEKEMRESGVEYHTFKKEKLGSIVNTDKEERPLLDKSDDYIRKEFEYYNPRDEFLLKMKSDSEISDKKDIDSTIIDLVDNEIKVGHAHALNVDLLEHLNIDDDKIKLVKISKVDNTLSELGISKDRMLKTVTTKKIIDESENLPIKNREEPSFKRTEFREKIN